MSQIDPHAVLDQLLALEESGSSAQPEIIASAREWREAILDGQAFLDRRDHPVVFIGKVGGGKSSLIGVASNLIVGSAPTDKSSLKNHSVLATGGGRTTVCEVEVRSAKDEDQGQLGLLIEPFTADEMRREIKLYAEDEWARSHPEAQALDEEDVVPTAQEVQRVIRRMTGYAEYQEATLSGRVRRRRTVRPLDVIVPSFDKPDSLEAHLIERANLAARKSTAWWWNVATEEALKELKACFEAVNQGGDPNAMLPRRMTVVVPDTLPGVGMGWDLSLIDTRGLDEAVESRSDLQRFLRNPRALLVLCSSFMDAPEERIRGLLHSMSGDAQLRQAIQRTLLLLVDMGDADQVNGAEGDRESGQELKIDECLRALEGMPLPVAEIDRTQLFAFDVLKDDRSHLAEAIAQGLARLRQNKEEDLATRLEDAQGFLNAAADTLRPVLLAQVDAAIRETMVAHLPLSTPLSDPLAGLYQAINETRYASVVYATCRRNGSYLGLDLYAAVESEASRAATAWLDGLIDAVIKRLDSLEADPVFERVRDYIRLTKARYRDARIDVTQEYATRVQAEVRVLLRDNPVWDACRREWGRGNGFKGKVLSHIEGWARREQGLLTHQTTSAPVKVPLWGEVARPAQAPSFTLHVRNLRALRQVDWIPAPLSLLIGANGAGKTTLMQILKLLHVAYERGLPEAVTQVLGGSGNLRSWDAPEAESVELGLTIGEAKWRVRLSSREGSVDYLAEEHLLDGERQVFSRDGLGVFLYGGERIEPTPQLGLRALTDRGAHEPSVRAIAAFLRRIAVYHDPDLWALRWQGSNTSEDRVLNSRGSNVLALLRRWQQERVHRHRYQFVLEGLNAAFPNIVSDMDFQEAGNTLVARFYHPGEEIPTPLAAEANGVLQLLLLLCQVAEAEDESLIAIDEPENGLHPYALRAFLRRVGAWARQHKLTVLLATHSTVLLDEFSAMPEQVFVMKPTEPGTAVPTALDQLCDRAWLEGFKLGDLYEQGEIGSNEDEG